MKKTVVCMSLLVLLVMTPVAVAASAEEDERYNKIYGEKWLKMSFDEKMFWTYGIQSGIGIFVFSIDSIWGADKATCKKWVKVSHGTMFPEDGPSVREIVAMMDEAYNADEKNLVIPAIFLFRRVYFWSGGLFKGKTFLESVTELQEFFQSRPPK